MEFGNLVDFLLPSKSHNFDRILISFNLTGKYSFLTVFECKVLLLRARSAQKETPEGRGL